MTTHDEIRDQLAKSKARWKLDKKAHGEVPHYSFGHIIDEEKPKSTESNIDTILANVKKLRSHHRYKSSHDKVDSVVE